MTYYNRKTNSFHVGDTVPTKEAIKKTIVGSGAVINKILVDDLDFELIEDKPDDNSYYNGFQWLPIPIEKVVPQSITSRQAIQQLRIMGKLAEIETFIANSDNEALKIDWARASIFERQNSALNEVAALTGITQEMIDDFFIEASKL